MRELAPKTQVEIIKSLRWIFITLAILFSLAWAMADGIIKRIVLSLGDASATVERAEGPLPKTLGTTTEQQQDIINLAIKQINSYDNSIVLDAMMFLATNQWKYNHLREFKDTQICEGLAIAKRLQPTANEDVCQGNGLAAVEQAIQFLDDNYLIRRVTYTIEPNTFRYHLDRLGQDVAATFRPDLLKNPKFGAQYFDELDISKLGIVEYLKEVQ